MSQCCLSRLHELHVLQYAWGGITSNENGKLHTFYISTSIWMFASRFSVTGSRRAWGTRLCHLKYDFILSEWICPPYVVSFLRHALAFPLLAISPSEITKQNTTPLFICIHYFLFIFFWNQSYMRVDKFLKITKGIVDGSLTNKVFKSVRKNIMV